MNFRRKFLKKNETKFLLTIQKILNLFFEKTEFLKNLTEVVEFFEKVMFMKNYK